MAVVRATEEFERWIESLSRREQKAVLQVVKILEQAGIALGEPYSSALKGTKHPFRELRPKRGASPLRIIYAFDPRREALLLLGGDKGGDKRFYERAILEAEQLWVAHLEDLERGGKR
ncbi:MAG TPA: type II toxin-antitoxin system RelE/ParE family toxin [Anaeromyxobacteraceae bacterium]|nr:type II toxin-antitoxin system RelE/ParE family toxin [Anaeromyxobacteraceae bacterium]